MSIFIVAFGSQHSSPDCLSYVPNLIAKYFGSSLLHGDVVPVWVVSVWDIIRTEGCVCGSNDGAVSHHPICLSKPDAGAAKCVDAQPEKIDNIECA